MEQMLRPVERRVLPLHRQGLDSAEIARRFRRTPDHIERILEWTRIERSRRPHRRGAELSPIERRVLELRAQGVPHEEIARRFRRSPDFIRRVEGLAHYRQTLRSTE